MAPQSEVNNYMVKLFCKELFLQTMNGRNLRKWKNVCGPEFKLVPDVDDTCRFRLSPITMVTTNVSGDRKQELLINMRTGCNKRTPNALLVALLYWADSDTGSVPLGIENLFGAVNGIDHDNDDVSMILTRFIKNLGTVIASVQRIQDNRPPSLEDGEICFQAMRSAELNYSMLQRWATNSPGGIVMSRLIMD